MQIWMKTIDLQSQFTLPVFFVFLWNWVRSTTKVCFNSAMRATEYASAWPCTLHLLDDLATTGQETQTSGIESSNADAFHNSFLFILRLSSDHISINLALGATRRALRWQRAVCLWQGAWPKEFVLFRGART